MSTTEEIDRYILKKYEVHQRLGKGVSPPCNNLQRPSLRAGRPTTLYKLETSQQKRSSAPGTACAEQYANRHPCITSAVQASDIDGCAQNTISAET